MKDWKKSTIGVVGMGRTGLAVSRFLSNRGARVLAYDRRSFEAFSQAERESWQALEGVEPRTGHEKANVLDGVDLVIISPGVSDNIAPVQRQKQKGIPVWSEIELASREIHAPILAVGGTNGKSTTTELLGKMLEASGWNTFVGGNLGEPLIEGVGGDYDQYVVEVSSFQMENLEMFRTHVAVLLNVSADHLDRYPDIESYARAKGRMFNRMVADDVAVVNGDDPIVMSVTPQAPQVWKWSRKAPVSVGAWADDEGLHFVTPAAVFKLERGEIALAGAHNEENVMAATLAALTTGITPATVREVVGSFKGLSHRIELVRELRGVRFIDDSKGTNLAATSAAIRSVAAPVVLIAGGVDKGGDYGEILDVIRAHVKAVVVIGQAADAIAKAWGKDTQIKRADSMEEAVIKASGLARGGDAVLLSPACSSFDMFRDYKERGDRFKQAVMDLPA